MQVVHCSNGSFRMVDHYTNHNREFATLEEALAYIKRISLADRLRYIAAMNKANRFSSSSSLYDHTMGDWEAIWIRIPDSNQYRKIPTGFKRIRLDALLARHTRFIRHIRKEWASRLVVKEIDSGRNRKFSYHENDNHSYYLENCVYLPHRQMVVGYIRDERVTNRLFWATSTITGSNVGQIEILERISPEEWERGYASRCWCG